MWFILVPETEMQIKCADPVYISFKQITIWGIFFGKKSTSNVSFETFSNHIIIRIYFQIFIKCIIYVKFKLSCLFIDYLKRHGNISQVLI